MRRDLVECLFSDRSPQVKRAILSCCRARHMKGQSQAADKQSGQRSSPAWAVSGSKAVKSIYCVAVVAICRWRGCITNSKGQSRMSWRWLTEGRQTRGLDAGCGCRWMIAAKVGRTIAQDVVDECANNTEVRKDTTDTENGSTGCLW